MTSFRADLRQPLGEHSVVTVWAGPDPEHRALAGNLTFRTDEAEAFAKLVNDAEELRLRRESQAGAMLPLSDPRVEDEARRLHAKQCVEGCTHPIGGWLSYAQASLADAAGRKGA